MSPCSSSNGNAADDRRPGPPTSTATPAVEPVLARDRRVGTAFRRRENVAELAAHVGRGRPVHVDVDAPPRRRSPAASDRRFRGCGRRADGSAARRRAGRRRRRSAASAGQGRCRSAPCVSPVRPCPLDQRRAAPAQVARLAGIAGAPALRDPRHAARGAAAQDREARGSRPALVHLREDRQRVGARRGGDLLEADAFGLGQRSRGRDDEGRLVALAPMRDRREIGRVGLHQHPVERDVARDRAQVGRSS